MKRIVVTMILMPILLLLPAAAFTGSAYACGTSSAAQQVAGGIDETGGAPTHCGADGVKNAIGVAVNILSLIVGVAAIIAIINAGFKYITSGGEAGKVSNAKNTLVYAVIGIAIAVLAQLLVRVVITQANVAGNPCKSDPTISATSLDCKT